MRKHFVLLIAILGVTILSMAALAQQEMLAQKDQPTLDREAAGAEIVQQLKGQDPAGYDKAIASIRTLLDDDPGHVAAQVASWVPLLMAAKRYAAAEQFSGRIVLSGVGGLYLLEDMQRARVRALLALGRSEDALSAAKSLFNVSMMQRTGGVVQLMAVCMLAADGGNHERFDKFRAEQLAGAKAVDANTPAQRSSVMDSIKIDESYYQTAIDASLDDNFDHLCVKGDMLLLAGRAKEAREAYEEAYTVAPENRLEASSESIARVIKAQDGTIGRANAWVLSIRPKAGAAAPVGTKAIP